MDRVANVVAVDSFEISETGNRIPVHGLKVHRQLVLNDGRRLAYP